MVKGSKQTKKSTTVSAKSRSSSNNNENNKNVQSNCKSNSSKGTKATITTTTTASPASTSMASVSSNSTTTHQHQQQQHYPTKKSSIPLSSSSTSTAIIELPENSRIVQPSYLEKNTGKKDLVRRLRNLVNVLRDDDDDDDDNDENNPGSHKVVVEADSPDWPGLHATANLLATSPYLHHADKDVRLYTVLACIEMLTIYAPDVPWDEDEIIDIFHQLTRQIANLANISEHDPSIVHYIHILDVLANVRIGCILVDLVNNNNNSHHESHLKSILDNDDDVDSDNEDDNTLDKVKSLVVRKDSSTSAMDALVDLLSTLLHSVRREHPTEITTLIPQAISACLCDYHPAQGGIPFPIPILDVLLKCIGQGPTQAIIVTSKSLAPSSASKNNKGHGNNTSKTGNTIQQVEVPNPTYQVAAQVIRSLLNRIAQPISQLLNGLLNGEPYYTDQSSIRFFISMTEATPMDVDTSSNIGSAVKSKNKNSSSMSASTSKFQMDWMNDEQNEVYTIAYEFHRVAPQILATIVGTIVHGLHSTATIQRYGVTQFFGQLFASSHGQYASDYSSCFRDWLNRKNDIVPSIRLCIVQHCMSILRVTTSLSVSGTTPTNAILSPVKETVPPDDGSTHHDVALAVTETLSTIISTDPSLDVRTEAIHLVCDYIYQRPIAKINDASKTMQQSKLNGLLLLLLQAIASRVSSKQKQERRDAISGLAHIYSKHYVQQNIQPVLLACRRLTDDEQMDEIDEDVAVASITALHAMCETIHDTRVTAKRRSRGARRRRTSNDDNDDSDEDSDCDHDSDYNSSTSVMDLYRWIPAKVMQCICFTDSTDTEMRSRVVQIIDEFLLKVCNDKNEYLKKNNGFAIARAISWTSLLDSLVQDQSGENSIRIDLLQMTDKSYHRCTSTEYKFLQQLLMQRAALQLTVSRYIDARAQIRQLEAGSEAAMESDLRAMQLLEQIAKLTAPIDNPKVSTDDVLKSFHGARDKHIFRVLATIVDPSHSSDARRRALDELPKRTQSLGDATSVWVKNLAKRCAMGDSLNVDVIQECLRLACSSLNENDISSCAAFLSTVSMTVSIFPAICTPTIFNALANLFLRVRSASGNVKNDLHKSGIVTCLSSILSEVCAIQKKETLTNSSTMRDLEGELMQLCTRDGTPEQAKNAVTTLARMFNPSEQNILDVASNTNFGPLMNSLVSATRSKLKTDYNEGVRHVRAFAALSALANCAPLVFTITNRGHKVIRLALEGILLGRDDAKGDPDSIDDDSSDDENKNLTHLSPKKRQRSKSASSKNGTPHFKGYLLEDDNLSITCRRLCAVADFLVSHTRSTHLLHAFQTASKISGDKITLPSKSQTKELFHAFFQILKNQGLPPSLPDRKLCSSRQDRAALRQCAVISILRLCDSRLGLEQEMLSKEMWHTVGMSLLDEEKTVRIAIMEELSAWYKGTDSFGAYLTLPPKAPSLRFLSFVVFCSDGDRDHDTTNAHAANVGKVISSTRAAASSCITNLRKLTEATFTHCCAMGRDTEERFENHIKMLITPEYCVPFAFHLLSHRSETPSEGAVAVMKESEADEEFTDEESTGRLHEGQMRTLRKRLKVLLDCLVHTLGDRANNISFLLRMTEILGRHYTPLEVDMNHKSDETKHVRKSIDSNGSEHSSKRVIETKSLYLNARLKTICSTAREILLSFVKSDVNLTTYPGTIQLPTSLFIRMDLGTVQFTQSEYGSKDDKKRKVKQVLESKSLVQERAPSKSPRQNSQLIGASSENEGNKYNEEFMRTPLPLSNIKHLPTSKSPRPLSQAHLGSSSSKSDTRVSFSPVVQYQDGKVKKIALPGTTPIPKSNTPESGIGSSARRSIRSTSTSSRSAITLGATPPTDLPTGTAVDESETSDEEVLVAKNRHRSIRSGKGNDRNIASKFEISCSEPSSATVTQSSDSTDNGLSSQTSTDQTSSMSLSRPRKRSALSNDKTKSVRVKPNPKPNQVHKVNQGRGGKSKKILSDELDFDFDEENVPVQRNKAKNEKEKLGKSTAKNALVVKPSSTSNSRLTTRRR